VILPDSGPNDIKFLALAFHEIVGRLPTAMRTKAKNGVICVEGRIVDDDYTGPMLEQVLESGKVMKGYASGGGFEGQPLIVVPLRMKGEVVAAVAAVDISKGQAFGMMHKFRGFGKELSVERCLIEEGGAGEEVRIGREELRDLAIAFHELVGRIPLSIRSPYENGLLLEDGKVVDEDYTGPLLEKVIEEQGTLRAIAPSGRYQGQPLIVVPVMKDCRLIAVVGTVDVTKGGSFALMHKFRR
jgi:hypothetical protein